MLFMVRTQMVVLGLSHPKPLTFSQRPIYLIMKRMITTMKITKARLKEIIKEELENVIKEERGQQYQVQPKDVEKARSILNRMGAGYGLNDKGELVVADNFVKELISSGISVRHVPEYNKDWSHPSREKEA